MKHIFISYAKEDQPYAISIYEILKQRGFYPWLDIKDIIAGQDWKYEIDKAIHSSSIFIACLSKVSVSKRGYVQAELKTALDVLRTIPKSQIFLIPVCLDDCEVPQELKDIHWIDYRDINGSTKLIEVISHCFETYINTDQDQKTLFTSRLHPKTSRVFESPSLLFEDSLIEVNLPNEPKGVYYLRLDYNQSSRTFLYPFKPIILEYFSPKQLAEGTKIILEHHTQMIQVEFTFPRAESRNKKITRVYSQDVIALSNITSELASWPDFVSEHWHRYFYFKSHMAYREVDFEPLIDSVKRDSRHYSWYVTTKPVEAFVGKIEDKSGLLLLRHNSIKAPQKYWRVGIDLGDTYTRAFFQDVEKQENDYLPIQGGIIKPVKFVARAQPLTMDTPIVLKTAFFTAIGQVDPPERTELKTRLLLQETRFDISDDWLPCDGFISTHWISDWQLDSDQLIRNLKWNTRNNDPAIQSFLRCLLVMIQAEAIAQGAQVIMLEHAYPSAFSKALVASYNSHWQALEKYANPEGSTNRPKLKIREATATEVMAACYHLENEQGASLSRTTIVFNTGDRTSDIAICTQSEILAQEAVAINTGFIGRYLESPDAREFITWLETTLRHPPHNFRELSLLNILYKAAIRPSGSVLLFNDLIDIVEHRGNLDILVDQINVAVESRKLISYIIFRFGTLLYYAGILARKLDLSEQTDTYYVHLCGTDGILIKWVLGRESLVQQMFEAGLFGTKNRENTSSPRVILRISHKPKEEVGRGLLAKRGLKLNQEYLKAPNVDYPSVTAGESGYGTLQWDSELSSKILLGLPEYVVPKMDNLLELNTFLDAFKQGQTTKEAAKGLELDKVTAKQFEGRLLQRLFGMVKGCMISDIKRNDSDTILEPLFITEAKVLLEIATQNIGILG